MVKIVVNASVKKDGHINLTNVYKTAFDYVYSQTKDLKKSKEMAVATRWAAKFKDDYKVEFETEIIEADIKANLAKIGKNSSQIVPEPKPRPKKVEIELFGDIIFSGDYGMPHKSMASLRILRTNLIFNGIKMAADLLESITDIEPLTPKDANWPAVKYGFPYNYHPNHEFTEENRLSALRDYLIQILEEKFGLIIKICGNCENYKRFPDNPFCGHCSLVTIHSVYYNWSCSNIAGLGQQWIPKEIPPEKKEEEKTCGNCGRFSASIQGRPDIAYECFYDTIVEEFKTLEEAKKSKPCSIWVPEK